MCFVVFNLNKALEIVVFKKREHSINRKLRTFEGTVKWNFPGKKPLARLSFSSEIPFVTGNFGMFNS